MKRFLLGILFLIFKLAFAGILVAVAYYVPGQEDTQLRFVDYVIDVKTGALAAGAVAAVILCFYVFKFLSWLKNLPVKLKEQLKERRLKKAKECLLEAYICLSAGELETAIEMASKSKVLDKTGELQGIFEAQALFMAGDFEHAEIKFDRLRHNPKTRFLGLRGLITLRKKQGRTDEMRLLLIDALKNRPNSSWVLKELLDYNLKHLEFDKAATVVEQLRITGHLDKQQSNRYQALVLWLQAQQLKRLANDEAFESLAQQSLKLEPSLTQVTLDLAQHLYNRGHSSQAVKILEKGYSKFPQLDYLPVFQIIFAGESSLDQYRLVEDIIGNQANHRFSHIILANFAIAAKLWGQARLHVNILKEKPSQLVYGLLADLEKAEHPLHTEAVTDYLRLAAQAPHEGEWLCQNCHTSQVSWSVFCSSCNSLDQIIWESQGNSVSIKQLT